MIGIWSAAVLVLSGAAALVFQLLWVKQLSLVVGVDVYAVTVAVSAFFAGLAVGSAIVGRRADVVARPFRFYAALEIGIALLGVAATFSLAHAAPIFAALEANVGPAAWTLPFLLVGVPAVLMGGTVPVMLRAVTVDAVDIARTGGRLYAANTAGAIAGCLLAPFVLIPWLGVTGSALAAAALNGCAAVVAFAMGGRNVGSSLKRSAPQESLSTRSDPQKTSTVGRNVDPIMRRSAPQELAIRLYAIAGGIALGYEVVWSQAIVQLVSTRVFAFAIVLATYLTGLALGSAVYARIADRIRRPWFAFGLLIAAAGLVSIVEFATLGPWLLGLQSDLEEAARAATGNELVAMCARFALAAIGMVFVPTLLLGAAFPAAVRLTTSGHRAGRDVGAVLGWNTAGGILGTLVTGFVLIPALGLIHTLGLLAVAAGLVGIVAAMRDRDGRGRILVGAVAIATLALAIATPEDRLARLLTASRSGGDLVYYAESPGGTVAVVQQRGGAGTFRRLYIQGVSNSGDALTSTRYMRLQALLPLVIHRGEPRSALVIGFGTGITAGSLLAYPGLDRRVCAELLPAVVEAAPLFSSNHGAAADPRLEIRVRDGRRELLRSADRYDLITLEPPPPSAQGVVNLYSRDFYVLAKQRLQPNGILAQWWPLPTQNDEDSRALVRSFLDAFPYASLWTTELHEMLLIGANEPMELDAARIAARFARPDVASALAEVGVRSPAALLATWVTGREGLERYAGHAEPVTDDRPRIEYATWTHAGEFARVLPVVLALQGDPPLVNADPGLLRAIAEERSRLARFYEAGIRGSAGDRAAALALLQQVLAEDQTNPYYRWMAGLPPTEVATP